MAHILSWSSYTILELNPKSHIDCFAQKFTIQGNDKDGKIIRKHILFSVEVWELHHKKGTEKYDLRIAEYDEFKKILYEEGFIDIHIVIITYKISRYKYHQFIINELKRQVEKKFGIVELDMNIGMITWKKILKDIKIDQDRKQYKLIKWA